ncbi:hypothetical protein AAMO2058_000625600 [Amorphochlora amoebiformis]
MRLLFGTCFGLLSCLALSPSYQLSRAGKVSPSTLTRSRFNAHQLKFSRRSARGVRLEREGYLSTANRYPEGRGNGAKWGGFPRRQFWTRMWERFRTPGADKYGGEEGFTFGGMDNITIGELKNIGSLEDPEGEGSSAAKAGGGVSSTSSAAANKPRAGNMARPLTTVGQFSGFKKGRKLGVFGLAKRRFLENPMAYLPIPIIAALVGWLTNWLAVQMIFYPIEWKGWALQRWTDQPFGLFGWQGIVPAKAGAMSERMVDMVTTKLLCVPEVFGKLRPDKVSECLLPMVQDAALWKGLGIHWFSAPFFSGILKQCTVDLKRNIDEILNLKELVVGEMLRDRTILVDLFQKVGYKELRFLTDSGLFFGFLLGLIQMFAWLVFPRWWTLPLGGAAVGYLTNWLALKMIFEPVNPVKIFGNFEIQGLFLKRQAEVSEAFSEHLSKAVLTSQKMWGNMLEGSGAYSFAELLRRNVPFFIPDGMVGNVFTRLRQVLPYNPSERLHDYVDLTLGLLL